MRLTFEADADGRVKPVRLRLGNETDLVQIRSWRSPKRLRNNPSSLGFIKRGLDSTAQMNDASNMRTETTRRMRTREELLELEDKYFPGSLGNLLSLGAAHFRQTNGKNRSRSRRNGAIKRRRKFAGK